MKVCFFILFQLSQPKSGFHMHQPIRLHIFTGALSASSSVSRKRDGSLSSSIQSGSSKRLCLAAPLAEDVLGQKQKPIAQDSKVMEIASSILSMHDDLTAILVTYYCIATTPRRTTVLLHWGPRACTHNLLHTSCSLHIEPALRQPYTKPSFP